MRTKTEHINLNLTKPMLQELLIGAELNEINLSSYIRQLIEFALNNQSKIKINQN